MNKTFLTNIISAIVIVIGYFLNSQFVLMIGLFALSGSITNTLAIHMLFHKIPLIYGSGVIEEKFETFKLSIFELMMHEFFTKENIKKFLKSEDTNQSFIIQLTKVIDKTDLSPAYDSLKSAVMESNFGGMLGMFGGEKALEPLREPFEKKLKVAILEIINSENFNVIINDSIEKNDFGENVIEHIEEIVKSRLDELTPLSVKEIIQKIIKEHLGWLVIWGGVFGGLIGLLSSLLI